MLDGCCYPEGHILRFRYSEGIVQESVKKTPNLLLQQHLVVTIGELDVWGVSFVSLKDGLDFTTPAGRLMFNVIGAMAQFERDLIRERVRSGMANAKRKGVKLGRKRVQVDTFAIQRMRAEGLSFEAISKGLGFSVGTVFRSTQTVRSSVATGMGN